MPCDEEDWEIHQVIKAPWSDLGYIPDAYKDAFKTPSKLVPAKRAALVAAYKAEREEKLRKECAEEFKKLDNDVRRKKAAYINRERLRSLGIKDIE